MTVPKIVLTGGPGGGKTSLLRELRLRDPKIERFILVPEAATLLIQAGHRPGSKEFQLAVVALQLALEESCALPARPGQILVCDRSTVDSLAYWRLLGGEDEEFYERTGLNQRNHLNEYLGVLHLQTAAIGAVDHYLQITDGARVETAEEAARVDDYCLRVWDSHPRRLLVENLKGDWSAKTQTAIDCLDRLLDEIGETKSEGIV